MSNKMNFGQAIEELKAGRRVSRDGWNGDGMFLILVQESKPEIADGSPYFDRAGLRGRAVISAHIDMYTATGEMQPGWLASQSDMLADDWALIEAL